jgi:hypothetical protein
MSGLDGVQRYRQLVVGITHYPVEAAPHGPYVLAADAERVIRKAVDAARQAGYNDGWEKGSFDGAAATERKTVLNCIAALRKLTAGRTRMPYDESRADQVASHNAYLDAVRDAIAALRALLDTAE